MPITGTPCRIRYFAYDTVNRTGKTGDVSNHSIFLSIDDNFPNAVAPTNAPIELDSINLPGWYGVDLLTSETTCNTILIGGKSSSPGIVIQGTQVTFESLFSEGSITEIVASIFAFSVEGNHSFLEIMKYVAAFVAGLTQGGGTPEIVFRNLDNTLDRIKFDLDQFNNRTTVTRDLT